MSTLGELIRSTRNGRVVRTHKERMQATSLSKKFQCITKFVRENFRISVYENGFAVYESENRRTVIDLDNISGLTYYFNTDTKNEFNLMFLESLSWVQALTLLGEEQISQNIFRDKAQEALSEDEDKKELTISGHIDGPETAYIKKETRREIRVALRKARAQMTEKQAEAFMLYYDQDMSEEEIGEILRISHQAVACRIRGATRKLRGNMKRFLQ